MDLQEEMLLGPSNECSLYSRIAQSLHSHRIEILILAASTLITLVNVSPYLHFSAPAQASTSQSIPSQEQQNESYTEEKPELSHIYVEISGAVAYPDVYELPTGARLNDLIQRSGGYTQDTDTSYVARNVNLARYLADQEKIYIPSKKEIASGLFKEPARSLDYLQPAHIENTSVIEQSSAKGMVSLNNATSAQLEELPGIGPTTAQKIIGARPFTTTDELLSRQIVKSSVFEQIKSLISL